VKENDASPETPRNGCKVQYSRFTNARGDQVSVLFDNENVLIIGGGGTNNNAFASAELYEFGA
jgi:hypothetical protein